MFRKLLVYWLRKAPPGNVSLANARRFALTGLGAGPYSLIPPSPSTLSLSCTLVFEAADSIVGPWSARSHPPARHLGE